MKAEEAINEFAEKWTDGKYRRDTDAPMVHLISDLNSLISEHYYPKEFLLWTHSQDYWEFKVLDCVWVNDEPTEFQEIKTTDELFNYWKENEEMKAEELKQEFLDMWMPKDELSTMPQHLNCLIEKSIEDRMRLEMREEELKREFAKKWGTKEAFTAEYDRYYRYAPEACLSDLTALISEHYYPKEFATLHAQRIADKMVEERLREELIKYVKWYGSFSYENMTDEMLVNEYLKTRESHD